MSSVYFLINTCLRGLRSSEILSNEVSRVHHHRPDVEEREEKGREKERWRANTRGACWSHATGEFGKGIAREELGKLNVVFEVEPFVFEKATM